jgi:hypothetical protein
MRNEGIGPKIFQIIYSNNPFKLSQTLDEPMEVEDGGLANAQLVLGGETATSVSVVSINAEARAEVPVRKIQPQIKLVGKDSAVRIAASSMQGKKSFQFSARIMI